MSIETHPFGQVDTKADKPKLEEARDSWGRKWRDKFLTSTRRAISEKWGGAVPQGVYYVGDDPLDVERLSLGEHGSQKWETQRAYHSILSGYIADRVHNARNWVIIPLLYFVLVPLVMWTFASALKSPSETLAAVRAVWTWVAVFMFVVPHMPFGAIIRVMLPKRAVNAEEEQSAKDILARCLVRVPAADNVPADVADLYRVQDVDSDGDSVAGQILPSEMEICPLAVQLNETRIIFSVFALILLFAVWFPSHWAIMGITVKYWLVGAALLGLFRYELSEPKPADLRGEVMDKVAKESATEYLVDTAGREYFKNIEASKTAQQVNAAKDDSPLYRLGRASGLFFERRDPFAPATSGMDMCLSGNDLATHLFALGASGTGKTSGVIRPVISQWIEHDEGGLFVIDGKGQLASELEGAPDYRVISPDGADYNPIEGLLPEEVADACAQTFGGENKQDGDIWTDSARTAIMNAAVMLHEKPDEPYTLKEIYSLLTDKSRRDEIAEWVAKQDEDADISQQFLNAFDYWTQEFESYGERIQGSIMVTAKTWLAPVVLSRKLEAWNNVETGVKIEDVLDGARMGLSIPEAKYGRGGKLVSMLAMRRLYQALKLRGDNWQGGKAVLLAADEVQNLVGAADLEMVPVARSFGLRCMFATQNIDGLYSRLGKEKTNQLLGNFANIISFAGRTEASDEWLSKRVGQVWKTQVEQVEGFPDVRFSIDNLSRSGGAKRTHGTRNDIFQNRNNAFGRTSHVSGIENNIFGVHQLHAYFKILLGIPMPDQPNEKQPYAQVQIKPVPLVHGREIDTLLSRQGLAIAVFRRAGVLRRDMIEISPMYDFGGEQDA